MEIEIINRDYWFKVVEFLQQNWVLIDKCEVDKRCNVFFINDASGVFDKIQFSSFAEAQEGLRRNGFKRYSEDTKSQKFIAAPEPPFRETTHSNGPIYSSGRLWK